MSGRDKSPCDAPCAFVAARTSNRVLGLPSMGSGRINIDQVSFFKPRPNRQALIPWDVVRVEVVGEEVINSFTEVY